MSKIIKMLSTVKDRILFELSGGRIHIYITTK